MVKTASVKEAEFMLSEARRRADEMLRGRQFAEARELLKRAVASLPPEEVDEFVACRVMLGRVERDARNLFEARRVLVETAPAVEQCRFRSVQAKFHHALAVTYKQIAVASRQPDFFDNALIEYEAARWHFEHAGDPDGAGYVANNVALVYCELGDTEKAREHLRRARGYFSGQPVRQAEMDDTEAQICIAEGDRRGAYRLSLAACITFEARGEEKLLADATRTLLKAAADWAGGD